MADAPLTPWDDPRVQAVCRILTADDVPPAGAHWEGFVARKIVDALAATPSPPVAAPPATPGLIAAYAKGFYAAAGWAKRPDLYADIGSPAYVKEREQMLANLATKPQPQPAQPLMGARPERCPSCRNGDLYSCTCPFPTSRNAGPPHPDTAQPLTADQRQDLLAAAFYIACRNETGATLKDVDAERIAELLTELSGFDLARITAPSTPTPPEVAP